MTTGCQKVDSDENDVSLENEKPDGNTKRKIPKLFRRPVYGDNNKKLDILPKKVMKPSIRNSSPQDSLLDINAQVKVNQNILDLQNKTGLALVQKNGQRKLGPPPDWKGPPPGPGCEVFIGRIPRNIYEDVIYPVFSSVGEIYEIRLMMNFSGTNRGFCFIMYAKPEYADRAIRELNNYEIYPNWRIGVVASVNNCRLHITELPMNTDVKKLIKKIWPACDDIQKVSLYTSTLNPRMKHALISFRTHRSAAMARRRLLPDQDNFFGKANVHIEWAHPKMIISEVIEECGYCDENGKITITKKITDKKNANIKKRLDQNSYKLCNSTAVKNMETVNHAQKIYEQTFKDRLVNNNAELYNKNQSVCKVDFCNKCYMEQSVNNNVQKIDVNQNVCKQPNNSIEDNSMKYFDYLKYSIRSDESLSDFSKSSDIDDSNCSYRPIGTSTPHEKVIPPFIYPSNCSVVRIPWGYHPTNQLTNLYQNNASFHTVRFPWHLIKVVNPNAYHVPVNITPVQNRVITNAVPNYILNNVKNIEQFRLSHVVNKTARPILNRKSSFY